MQDWDQLIYVTNRDLKYFHLSKDINLFHLINLVHHYAWGVTSSERDLLPDFFIVQDGLIVGI